MFQIKHELQFKRLSKKYNISGISQNLAAKKQKHLNIGLHLLQNNNCADNYNNNMFRILALEATFIKTLDPVLCRQKESVYTLKIAHFPADHVIQLRPRC